MFVVSGFFFSLVAPLNQISFYRLTSMLRIISILLISLISLVSFLQTDHSSQLHICESKFSEQEFVAADHNTIIGFILNTDPKSSFAKMNILVKQGITIVPPIVLRKK